MPLSRRRGTLQEAFREARALQCGFCTPGLLVSVDAFLRSTRDPSDEEIREALAGNLCRCTGYLGIIEAVRLASSKRPAPARSKEQETEQDQTWETEPGEEER